MKRNVMKKAWELARAGQKRFGGTVKSFFSEALKMAWVEIKNADLFNLFERAAKLCVSGKSGLQKLAKSTGKTDIIEIITGWIEESNAKNHQELGLWLNLEINKL